MADNGSNVIGASKRGHPPVARAEQLALSSFVVGGLRARPDLEIYDFSVIRRIAAVEGTSDSAAHDAEGGSPDPHMGTSGASNCRETTGSPSERAPGQG